MVSVPTHALLVALVLSATLATLLLVVTAGGRALRLARERRDELRTAEPRKRLVAVMAEGDLDDPDLDRLAALDRRTWRALEPTLVAMAVKLRGDSRRVVVSLLERRGAAASAVHRARRRGAVGRARAAEMLGVTGGPGSLPALARLLDDRRREVRAVAVRALGRTADPTASLALLTGVAGRRHGRLPAHLLSHALLRLGPRAVPALRTALLDDRPEARGTAVELLGLLGAVAAADDLVDVLRGDEVDEVRVRAARALGLIGPVRAVGPLVAATASTEPATLRAAAAAALGEIGAPAAVGPLTALVGEPDHWVAHHAAASLTRVGPAGVTALRSLLGPASEDHSRAHARDALVTARLDDTPLEDSQVDDTRPVGTRPLDTRPLDTRPLDTRPLDARSRPEPVPTR